MYAPTSTSLPRSGLISGETGDDLTDFDGAVEILRTWGAGLTPDPDLTVSEWADRHRMLSGRASAEPGRYRKVTSPKVWSVNGVARANAHLVSRGRLPNATGSSEAGDEDRPVYGGTPADFAVVQAIREMKARGLRVTFYPFLLMDVPPGNTLPNPYSANAATPGQPSFPWRGRITCSPAAGYAGTADKTAAAATQVASFFGAATPAQFAISGDTVTWTGPSGDWGLRRMILHYAHLCAVAGGAAAMACIATFFSALLPTRTTACRTMASTAAFSPKNSAETKPTSPQIA